MGRRLTRREKLPRAFCHLYGSALRLLGSRTRCYAILFLSLTCHLLPETLLRLCNVADLRSTFACLSSAGLAGLVSRSVYNAALADAAARRGCSP